MVVFVTRSPTVFCRPSPAKAAALTSRLSSLPSYSFFSDSTSKQTLAHTLESESERERETLLLRTMLVQGHPDECVVEELTEERRRRLLSPLFSALQGQEEGRNIRTFGRLDQVVFDSG